MLEMSVPSFPPSPLLLVVDCLLDWLIAYLIAGGLVLDEIKPHALAVRAAKCLVEVSTLTGLPVQSL